MVKVDINEDEFRAVFEICSKTTKNKADKVDKTKLLKLSVEKVIRIGFFTIPTS